MIYLGLKESLASWKGVLARALLTVFIGFTIGTFWRVRTGDPSWVLYLMLAEVVMFNRPKAEREMTKLIQTGRLDLWLTRPRTIFRKFLSVHLGRSLAGLALGFLLSTPVYLLYGFPNFLYLPVVLLAFIVNYALTMVMGYAAFWVGESRPLGFLMDKVKLIFSGVLIPFEFFPGWLAETARFLPFRFTAYVPAKALMGQPDFIDIGIGLLWAAVLMGLALWMEKRGVMRYEMVGG